MEIYQTERLMEMQTEEDLVKMALKQVIRNNMTISNVKEIAAKIISYMEANAILEMEDSDNTKSSTQG